MITFTHPAPKPGGQQELYGVVLFDQGEGYQQPILLCLGVVSSCVQP